MKLSKKYWQSLSENQQQRIKDALKTAITAISVIVATIFGFTSCGVTRATIAKPAEGSSTTITITTNNPITTTPTLNTDLQHGN